MSHPDLSDAQRQTVWFIERLNRMADELKGGNALVVALKAPTLDKASRAYFALRDLVEGVNSPRTPHGEVALSKESWKTVVGCLGALGSILSAFDRQVGNLEDELEGLEKTNNAMLDKALFQVGLVLPRAQEVREEVYRRTVHTPIGTTVYEVSEAELLAYEQAIQALTVLHDVVQQTCIQDS